RACAVTPDRQHVLSGSDDSTLRAWDAETGTEIARLPTPGWVLCIATHAASNRFVFGDATGGVYQADLVGT
ncbi:MAG: hypothetical protein KKE89_00490, partial [Actinobacteria bacterium]|nr:hypothetical protein [Actinomycetota bacterium]